MTTLERTISTHDFSLTTYCGTLVPERSPTEELGYSSHHATASLMRALQAGRTVSIGTMRDGPTFAALSWALDDHEERWGHFVSDNEYYFPVAEESSEEPWNLIDEDTGETGNTRDSGSRIDHLLQAAERGYPIYTWRSAGSAGIWWERDSHGNRPALHIAADGRAFTEYEASPELTAAARRITKSPPGLVEHAVEMFRDALRAGHH